MNRVKELHLVTFFMSRDISHPEFSSNLGLATCWENVSQFWFDLQPKTTNVSVWGWFSVSKHTKLLFPWRSWLYSCVCYILDILFAFFKLRGREWPQNDAIFIHLYRGNAVSLFNRNGTGFLFERLLDLIYHSFRVKTHFFLLVFVSYIIRSFFKLPF